VGYASAAVSVLVIGAASLDVLHWPNGQTAHAAGGAGLYTALAAHHAGAPTTLLAPRPQPLPTLLEPIAERVQWLGPTIAPADVPRLEIAHLGSGRAQLLNAHWGVELTPEDLPAVVSGFAWIHIAALRSAQRQLDFLRALRARGAAHISAGTYAHVIQHETETVRALLNEADAFFMNENEANGLFGSIENARPNGLLFITRGALGAVVMDGTPATALPAPIVDEVDPTGAGDTFCGAVLAHLALGASPINAARRGITLASQMIAAIGPEMLLDTLV
jgi:sugar/nucleoside kinase (ribokinase family)